METIMVYLGGAFDFFSGHFWALVQQPFSVNHRFYWFYIFTSILFVYGVYYFKTKKAGVTDRTFGGFLSFMFPKKVWGTASAWLDVRFYFVNHFTGKLLYAGLITLASGLVYEAITGESFGDLLRESGTPTWREFGVSLLFLVMVGLTSDFAAFFIHYLQHKVPLLWEFHKVHHSPEVMHPMSNHREHPIDNIVYALGIGAVFGMTFSFFGLVFNYLPNIPAVMGVPLLAFLFNVGGYHLRHSHVWLRWPGNWSKVFPSPAHHHVHHSRHPDHLDKNFAFLFPMWDVIFKTYHMPEDERDVEFGIHGSETQEYDSILKMYFLPFIKIWNVWKKGERLTIGKPDRSAVDLPEAQTPPPAEVQANQA